MEKTLFYTAYVQKMKMYQFGENYMEEQARDHWDEWKDFSTRDAAIAWAEATHERMVTEGEDYAVTRHKTGLDYIEYHDYVVVPFVTEDDEDDGEYDFDREELVATMPDAVRNAAEESKRSYHRFLDYMEDHYESAADILYEEE